MKTADIPVTQEEEEMESCILCAMPGAMVSCRVNINGHVYETDEVHRRGIEIFAVFKTAENEFEVKKINPSASDYPGEQPGRRCGTFALADAERCLLMEDK
jgi:hypothetical protein